MGKIDVKQASAQSDIMHSVLVERQIFISTALANRPERRLALTVVVLSFASFICVIPFARLPLLQVWAFIPIYESALIISDLITAILLFAQYNLLRTRSLLVLASGYLFTAAMIVPHALTFPGLFSPTGLLDAGPQSTAGFTCSGTADFRSSSSRTPC
jgi:hypothetical protein